MSDTHDRLRRFWDADAATYDDTPSHSASDPVEAAAWRAAMRVHLPAPPSRVLDAGAGTGAMSLLAAELGYDVTAFDLSEGMLGRLREKATAADLRITTSVSSAEEPPEGAFDAVIARHLVWTLPDPVKALSAWRTVAAHLLLFEGEWGAHTSVDKARAFAGKTVKRALRIGHDHHRHYEPELSTALPFASGTDPSGLLKACAEAGWKRLQITRLRDVEWARDRQRPIPLRPFEGVPQFAITAEA